MSIITRYATLFILTMLSLSALSFTLAYLFPGDVLTNLTGIVPHSEEQRALLTEKYRLNDTFLMQFFAYLGTLLNGDWGMSFSSGLPLRDEIGLALPATIELSAYALLLSLMVGLPLGIYAGMRCYSVADYTINSVSIVNYSLPVFWLALIFIMVFSLDLGLAPLSGRVSLLFEVPPRTGFILIDIFLADDINTWIVFQNAVSHFILPTLAVAIVTTASLTRLTRRSVIDVLNSPYLAAARSRGLSTRQIFLRHMMRNILLPVLPLFAIQITTLITNVMIIETLFSWPGIGNWLLQAIYQRDFPALRVGMLAVASVIILLTILIDLFNRIIDPSRERVEHASR